MLVEAWLRANEKNVSVSGRVSGSSNKVLEVPNESRSSALSDQKLNCVKLFSVRRLPETSPRINGRIYKHKGGCFNAGLGSSLLVNRICDMGYVHPVFPTSAAKLFWRTTETRHHPPGQPRHPSSKQNALIPSRVANTRVEPCSLTSLLSGPMNTHLMLTVCLQDRL